MLFVLLLRFIWLLEPYYYPTSGKPQDRLFGDTFDDHATVAEFFLRIPQILLFLVLLLQIKSWRQTVRHTRKLKSKKIQISKKYFFQPGDAFSNLVAWEFQPGTRLEPENSQPTLIDQPDFRVAR